MLAIIKTGGKQYTVAPGRKILVEKLAGETGKEVSFPLVLLLEKENKVELGTPLLKGVQVKGKILKQGKADKVIAFRYKQKTRHKVKRGHRQQYTEVEITDIVQAK